MSKSSGHFITLQTSLPAEKGFSLKDKGYEPLDYRFFLLGGHYRKQLVFSLDALESAKNGRAALNQRVAKLIARANDEEKLGLTKENFAEVLGKINYDSENFEKFKQGLENDLATPVAMAAIQKEAAGKGGVKAGDALSAILKMDAVLSLDVIKNAFDVLEKQQKIAAVPAADDHAGDPEAEEINALVAERTAAKKNKDFARADEIRNQLAGRGITIVDGPNGAVWHR
jgi:cysteinyl-tRNA synthetase